MLMGKLPNIYIKCCDDLSRIHSLRPQTVYTISCHFWISGSTRANNFCSEGFPKTQPSITMIQLVLTYVGIFSFFYQSKTQDHICIFHLRSLHTLLQYTVVPTRRSTAEAMMIFIGHLLGDAGSPYFVGLVRNSNFRLIRSNQLTLHVYLFLCHITVNQSVIFVVNWQTVSFKLFGIVYCPFLR